MNAIQMEPDFAVENHGSIFLVRPINPEVKNWLVENVSGENQWFGGAMVVEPRYVDNLVDGLESSGFGPKWQDARFKDWKGARN